VTFINSPHKRIEVTIYLLSIFGSMCQGRVGKHRVQRHEPCLHGDNKRQNFPSFCRGSDKSLISEGLLTVHKDADYMNAAAEAGGSAYVVEIAVKSRFASSNSCRTFQQALRLRKLDE